MPLVLKNHLPMQETIRDTGSIHGLGRSSGGGHGNPFQYSCLENPHGQRSLASYSSWSWKESDITERLSTAQDKVLIEMDLDGFAVAAAKQLQSCLTLCDPIDGSPPGSSVLGILQARTLEWIAISFSNAWKWKMKVKSLSHVWLLATPWTAAFQAPHNLFMPAGAVSTWITMRGGTAGDEKRNRTESSRIWISKPGV